MTAAPLLGNIREIVLRRLLLPAGDMFFQQGMIRHLSLLEEAQWWSPERVQIECDRRLRALVEVAFSEVPFYRELIRAAGVMPSDVRQVAELSRLPVVTKRMLRESYPARTVRQTGHRTYEACTSGSTGQNLCVREDAPTAGQYRAAFILALEWAGWKLGEPHIQTGMTLDRSLDRRLKDVFLGSHYVSAHQLDDGALQSILCTLEKNRIKHLWGYASSLHVLAKFALQCGWNQKLSSVVCWGDTLFPHYRSVIQEAFGAQAFDSYGCAEGIQIAAQCPEGRLHIHSLDTIVEIVDDSGTPVPTGEVGNILLTRLHPGPMPFIRYQVGDLGSLSTATECPCGRGFALMESIIGRNTDIVLTPTGNRLIVHFFTSVLEHFPEIESFQVVQDAVDAIVLRVVPTQGFSEEVSKKIVTALRAKGASDLRIDIEVVPAIPLPRSGKHRFVLSTVCAPE